MHHVQRLPRGKTADDLLTKRVVDVSGEKAIASRKKLLIRLAALSE